MSPDPRSLTETRTTTLAAEAARRIERSAVPAVLDIIGDRWTLAIVAALDGGPRRFDELVADLGVPRSTLAARLRRLVAAGCLHRRAYQQRPVRYEYRRAPPGRDLAAVGAAVVAWDARWRAGAGDRSAAPDVVCAACGAVVRSAEVRYSDDRSRPVPRRFAGKRARVTRPLSRQDSGAAVLEDRWSSLIIAAVFFGVHRFADLAAATRISPNILAARLRALIAARLIARRRYQERPPRHDYVMTDAGLDLYGIVLSLVLWGERWLRVGHGARVRLVHLPCGKPLQVSHSTASMPPKPKEIA